MEKLAELRRKLGVAIDALATDAVINDVAVYDAKKAEIATLRGQIARTEEAQREQAGLARPVATLIEEGVDIGGHADMPGSAGVGMLDTIAPRGARRRWDANDYLRAIRKETGFKPDKGKHFLSIGEQLKAIANYYTGGRDLGAIDKRLIRAPTGAYEGDSSAGGFLVQTDFSQAIFMRAYDMGEILSRVRKLTISSNSNGIKIPAIDETSRATGSRFGGVQSYWIAEGGTLTASKPKFRLIELDLKKLASAMYVTDELLADQSVLTSLANEAFSEELMFMTEDSIVEGTGAGQPLGILNAPSLITVAKSTGQAAGTVTYENIVAMWARMWVRSRANAVWFINQDVEGQLFTMSQTIGTGGVPVYLPANGISGSSYGTLFGRPVVPIEYGSALGTAGDIILADLSQYVLADKGGVQSASSMHVAFLTDEMVFRFIYRVDGEPIWNAPLTPFKGSVTKSPFVTLANR